MKTGFLEGHTSNNIIIKSGQQFWTRRFFKSSLYTYKENKVRPFWPCFLTDRKHLINLGRRSPKKHLCNIFFKTCLYFLDKKIFKVFAFFNLSDATETKVIHGIEFFEQL